MLYAGIAYSIFANPLIVLHSLRCTSLTPLAGYRDDSELRDRRAIMRRISVFKYRSRIRVVGFVQRSFIISPKP